jgi:hypothetical protein
MHDLTGAACAAPGTDPELFYDVYRQAEARAMCLGCPVRAGCLANALEHELADAEADGRDRHADALHLAYGMWGATTGTARRSMRPGQQIGLPTTTPPPSQARFAA